MIIFMNYLLSRGISPRSNSFNGSPYVAYRDLSSWGKDSAGLGMIETCGTNADEFEPMPDDFKIGILF
jgi:hypothetical protein